MRDCAPQKAMDARSFSAGRGAARLALSRQLFCEFTFFLIAPSPPALCSLISNRRPLPAHTQAEHSAVAPYMMLDHTHGEGRVAELWASGACPRPAFEKRSGRRYSSVTVSRNGIPASSCLPYHLNYI
jgi:hypothetical protein